MNASSGHGDSPAGQIRLRYWASVRAAAGSEEDLVEVAGSVTLASLVARAKELHADSIRFGRVLDTCSTLVDDRPFSSVDAGSVWVDAGQTVEFLPPFAGG